MVYESKLNHSPNWAKSSCPHTSQNWEKQTLEGTGALFTSFHKFIGESFLPKEKLKLTNEK
jgi:hypothetical protein